MARNSDKQKAESQISEKISEKIPEKKRPSSDKNSAREIRVSTNDDVAEGSREDVDQSLEHDSNDHEKNPTLH